MKKPYKKILLTIAIIIFTIIGIFGGITFIYSFIIRDENETVSYVIWLLYGFKSQSLIFTYLFNLSRSPYFYFIRGFLLLILGIIGPVISISIYISYKTSPKPKSHIKGTRLFKTRSRYRIKSGKGLSLARCPGCKAPLKKIPPCECEYCGSIIK
ncbi:MAG: hypothetical protein ACFFDN_01145 [Candidatus Hodarchaeota archaeon]